MSNLYPPPGPYGQPQQVVVVQGPPTSGLATASMILGILGLVSSCCTFGIFSIFAVVFGHIAMRDIKRTGMGGEGMAQAGLVLGYIVAAPAIILSTWFLLGAGMSAITSSTSH